VRSRCRGAARPCRAFLDLDGEIVNGTQYLEDMRIMAGAAAAIARCNALQIPVVVATNQAGISRYYGWDAFHAVQDGLKAEGPHLNGVVACAYHAEDRAPLLHNHPWRKSNPGMIVEAARLETLSNVKSSSCNRAA
jgi:D-glycero-D-manno-heptose 1,7-bisphosphate phosphatase